MLLKRNLHTQTTKSKCGKWEPIKVMGVYKRLQYDFLCISDHNEWWDGLSEDEEMTLIIGNESSDCRLTETHVIELRYPSVDQPKEVLRILAHP